MPPVIGTATTSDWSFAGSLLTFFFPVILFIVVATALYLEFTRPHTVPGLAPANPAPAARDTGSTSPDEQPAARTDDDHEAPDGNA
jgi:hypothetical protein